MPLTVEERVPFLKKLTKIEDQEEWGDLDSKNLLSSLDHTENYEAWKNFLEWILDENELIPDHIDIIQGFFCKDIKDELDVDLDDEESHEFKSLTISSSELDIPDLFQWINDNFESYENRFRFRSIALNRKEDTISISIIGYHEPIVTETKFLIS